MVARVAGDRGLPETLVWQWLADAGELGRPRARRPGGARMGGQERRKPLTAVSGSRNGAWSLHTVGS
jgi:hypothetical protein